MSLSINEIARRDERGIEMRPNPVRVRWTLDDVAAADRHRLTVTLACSARALADRNNAAMLEEVFLAGTDHLTIDALTAYAAPAMRAAVAKVAATRNAVDWLSGDGQSGVSALAAGEMVDALRNAADTKAFTCGVEFLPPFELCLESPTLRRQKIEELERSLRERRVAGQLGEWEKVAGLLKQFRAIRDAAPELSPSAVLEQVSPSERGAILQTLLRAAGQERATKYIWVIAGPSLLRIERASLGEGAGGNGTPAGAASTKSQILHLPTSLGPLRSIQPSQLEGRGVLLVGARNGVMILDGDGGEPQLYADLAISTQLGFSAALISGSNLWACHGDAGIVRWELSRPSEPALAVRPAQLAAALGLEASAVSSTPAAGNGSSNAAIAISSIRHLVSLADKRLMFSCGAHLGIISTDGNVSGLPLEEAVDVAAIVPEDRRVLIVAENGAICARDRQTLAAICVSGRGMRVVAAGSLPWLNVTRLLLAGGEGPIQCVGFDDSLVTEYCSAYRGPRLVAGAADLVAAVSADRQRLVLWNSWDGRRPAADLLISAIARHRVADVDFT